MIGNQDSNVHLKYIRQTDTTKSIQCGSQQQREKLRESKQGDI